MGKMILIAGLACVAVGLIIFLIYITAGKASERKLKKKLMEEY